MFFKNFLFFDQKNNEDFFFRFFFCLLILFQMTSLRVTLGIGAASFIVNAALCVLPLFYIVAQKEPLKLFRKHRFFSVCSTILIATFFINYFNDGLNINSVKSFFVASMPWLTLLMLLSRNVTEKHKEPPYWSDFSAITVGLTCIGLFEYFLLHKMHLSLVDYQQTHNGLFLVGYTTIFYEAWDVQFKSFDLMTFNGLAESRTKIIAEMLEGPGLLVETRVPTISKRFYGPFWEPGVYAMWGSVLLLYNLKNRNFFSVAVLSLALALTFSVSLLLAFLSATCLIFFKSSRGAFFLCLVVLLFASLICLTIFEDQIASLVFRKHTSFLDRFENLQSFLHHFGFLITNYPLGVNDAAKASLFEAVGYEIKNNFMLVSIFIKGGVIAFTVYSFLLVLLIVRAFRCLSSSSSKSDDVGLAIYFMVLLSFSLQRDSILESPIMAFLFAGLFVNSKTLTKTP